MIKTIFKRMMPFKKMFYVVNVLLLIIYVSQLLIPYVFSGFIDEVTQGVSIDTSTKPIMIIAGLTLILMICSYFHHITSEVLITKTGYAFLEDMDYKLEHMPLRETEKYSPAYLNNRLFNDILTTLGFVVHNFLVASIMLISTVVLFILIIEINAFLVLIPLLAMAINILGIVTLNKPYYKRGYQYKEDNNHYVSENYNRISQIKETKVHAWYETSRTRFKGAYKTVLKSGIRLNKILAALNNIGTFSKNITLILTMVIGGALVVNQTITIGAFILITYYTNMCLNYSEFFFKLGQEYQHAKISYHRLEALSSSENEPNGSFAPKTIDSVTVSKVSFAYPGKDVLIKNFSHRFEKGKIYCIKGKNGEGKTTLIDLILGLDYRFDGIIKYNDMRIEKIDMIALRNHQISVVMQEPRLDRLSVYDNLTKGLDNYTIEEVTNLIEIFGLSELMNLDTSQSLSGGEKQKVAIVRGLLKQPSLLIMDEPVSALDNTSITVLKQQLLKRKTSTIIILISHNDVLFDIVDAFIEMPKID
ncbi:MAG: ATP-binding cassette domain-containing protein [Bacillota bacterium]